MRKDNALKDAAEMDDECNQTYIRCISRVMCGNDTED